MSLARAHTDKQQEQSRTDPLVLWEDTKKWVDQIKKQATSK